MPIEKPHPADRDAEDSAPRIGFAMAVISTVFGILYLFGLLVNMITTGSPHSTSDVFQLISAVIAVLWNQVLVILFVTLRWRIPQKRMIFAELALVFMVLLSATSSVNWFVRLAIFPKVAQAGDATLLAWIDPYGERSVMFAMEHLGWGLFYGLATLFAALAIAGGGIERWIRGLLAAGSTLGLLHFIGIIISQPLLSFLGYPAWGLLLPVTTVLMAIRFRRE